MALVLDARVDDVPEHAGYDGQRPFPTHVREVHGWVRWVRAAVIALLVVGPIAGVVIAGVVLWGPGLGVFDVSLAGGLYVVTGLGVTVGFHRCFTHGSFRAKRGLRLALAVAGSLSFQGDVIGWVAAHRRHHAFTDRPGDPHSPHRYGSGSWAQVRGLVDSHLGWFLRDDPCEPATYAPDLLADPVLRTVSRIFPLLCLVSLAVPFGLGWAVGGTATAGCVTLLWAGLVRICLLQHVTWSVNSLCHLVGSRPRPTRRFDRSTNVWPLALLSFGESWHNAHHSDPTRARHGVDAHQWDSSAVLIRVFERLGWASDVKWAPQSRHALR